MPAEQAETVYAIGGLYGNPEALSAVLDLKREDLTLQQIKVLAELMRDVKDG